MDTLQPIPDARSRKSLQVLLNALASKGQRTVAAELGISETAISRMKSEGDLQRFAQLLTALGYKPVPVGAKCITPERVAEIEAEIANLRYWARRGIEAQGRTAIARDEESDTGLHWGGA